MGIARRGHALQHSPTSGCLSGVRVLLSMAVLLSLVLPSAAHARSRRRPPPPPSTAIFPSGRKLQPEPRIWVAAHGEPKPTITSKGRTVAFTIPREEFHMDGGDGLHWVEVLVELKAGTFTVSIGSEQETFTIDPSLALPPGGDFPDSEHVTFERMAIEQGARGATLSIDAIVAPDTVLYFLNHELPAESPSRYVWIGPGRPLGRATRFELPLSRLGTSCSASVTMELSLYSTGLITTTLYPIGTLTLDRGRVKLPLGSVGVDEEGQPWRPCPGAAVRVLPYVEGETWSKGRDESAPWPAQSPEEAAALRDQLAGPVSACVLSPPQQQRPSPSRPWAAILALALAVLAGLCAVLARRLPMRHLL